MINNRRLVRINLSFSNGGLVEMILVVNKRELVGKIEMIIIRDWLEVIKKFLF